MQKFEKLLPSKYYHIYNRGNNRENIFKEERNYFHFLDLWQKHVMPVAETYSYCLMKNHFHFLVRILDVEEITKLILTRNPDRVQNPVRVEGVEGVDEEAIIKRIKNNFSNHFNAYSQAFNTAYNRTGKLFETPFERKLVDNKNYFRQLIYYIHFNPQRHGFVKDFRDWKFSSYHSLLSACLNFL